jgi:hypothetical protein
MIDISFMDQVKSNIYKASISLKIGGIITSAILQAKLDSYLQNNHFRATINDISDMTLFKLRNYVHHHYDEDKELMVYKQPEIGVENDFSFTFFGNEEYDQHVFDRYLERGMIYTSKDTRIIPSPKEEAKAQGLLFRTSRGQIIRGDNFIDDFINEEMKLNTPSILRAYQIDVERFMTANKK